MPPRGRTVNCNRMHVLGQIYARNIRVHVGAEPLIAAASSPTSTPEAVTSVPVASVAMPEDANPAPPSNTSSAVDASLPVPNALGAAPSWSRNPARGWLGGLSTLEDWEAAPEVTHYKTVFEALREELQCALRFSDVPSVLFRPDRDGQLRMFRAALGEMYIALVLRHARLYHGAGRVQEGRGFPRPLVPSVVGGARRRSSRAHFVRPCPRRRPERRERHPHTIRPRRRASCFQTGSFLRRCSPRKVSLQHARVGAEDALSRLGKFIGVPMRRVPARTRRPPQTCGRSCSSVSAALQPGDSSARPTFDTHTCNESAVVYPDGVLFCDKKLLAAKHRKT